MAGRALTAVIVIGAIVIGVALVVEHAVSRWLERREMRRTIRRRLADYPPITAECAEMTDAA